METHLIIAVIFVGLLCGFINTLAGSGSLISLPMLIFLGLPPSVANGTNRIAILLQSLVGLLAFHKKKQLDVKRGSLIAVSAVLGSVVGAFIAANTNDVHLEKAIGIIMLIMLAFMFIKPEKWKRTTSLFPTQKIKPLQYVLFFAIGLYGGFIQAGAGVFLLIALVMGAGYDLIKANAIKLLIIFLFTPFTLSIFIFYGQVDFAWGMILAAGNMIGAWLAAKYAITWGPAFVRPVLIIMMLAGGIELLGIRTFITNVFF